jgi:hypothetical protein
MRYGTAEWERAMDLTAVRCSSFNPWSNHSVGLIPSVCTLFVYDCRCDSSGKSHWSAKFKALSGFSVLLLATPSGLGEGFLAKGDWYEGPLKSRVGLAFFEDGFGEPRTSEDAIRETACSMTQSGLALSMKETLKKYGRSSLDVKIGQPPAKVVLGPGGV